MTSTSQFFAGYLENWPVTTSTIINSGIKSRIRMHKETYGKT